MSEPLLPPHFLEIAKAHQGRGLPPVERWNPAYCGEIDMRIASDGRWFYGGSPIGRPALVRLFASILRKDPERHVLVTPVERVGILVEDMPFLAVEMQQVAGDRGPALAFRTNLDDIVVAGSVHPLRLELAPDGGFKPCIHVRGDLWARATRAVAIEIADRIREEDGRSLLVSDGVVFALPEVAHA